MLADGCMHMSMFSTPVCVCTHVRGPVCVCVCACVSSVHHMFVFSSNFVMKVMTLLIIVHHHVMSCHVMSCHYCTENSTCTSICHYA